LIENKYAVHKTNSGLCISKHPLCAGREMQCEEESRATVRSREGERAGSELVWSTLPSLLKMYHPARALKQ